MTKDVNKLMERIVQHIQHCMEDVLFQEFSGAVRDVLTELSECGDLETEALVQDTLDDLNLEAGSFQENFEMQMNSRFQDYVNRMRVELKIKPRYLMDKTEIIRSDLKVSEEEEEIEKWSRIILNREKIQRFLLSESEGTSSARSRKLDSDFEKICAIMFYYGSPELGNYAHIGVLRDGNGPDGGLDFFAIYDAGGVMGDVGIFGQAKRRKGVDKKTLSDWFEDYESGFIPMIKGKTSFHKYILGEGTSIQKKLKEMVGEYLNVNEHRPYLICAGEIGNTHQTRINDRHGFHMQGLEFVEAFCLSIADGDEKGFYSWFEEDAPWEFKPDSFEKWVESQTENLIIVDSKKDE